MVTKILHTKQIPKHYTQPLKHQLQPLQPDPYTPKLSLILLGNDGATQTYVNSKNKPPENIPIISQILHLHQSTSQPDVLNQLKRLNGRHTVTPILLQLP
ncbi:tetrahydrofolate dehydrogenase/cyclohydrolase catalytic domain-containing protein, partial [Staphylococcus saprophyticus]|uniref:tetrahydrofolate dehydrogenase/cyclohydrolase catalytic domain-containing protein n=1 Tax=Staphylococcus saprophyticus TaxID=29385 RepID=UPI0011A72C51